MHETLFNILQIVFSALLVALIALQQKGTGMSGIFGGSSNIYSTKRGVDKILHIATIVLSVIFFVVSILRFFL
jgi:preprotein translocase subunit SecG